METKKKRTQVLAGLLALVGLLLVWTLATAGDLEPSGAPGPTMKTLDEVEPRIPIHESDLPLVITQSGSYYFVEDIDFEPNNTDAITILCDDVTIDLMGYTLTGPDSGLKNGVYTGSNDNVEICNGTIRDFHGGIREEGSDCRYHRVINIHALSNIHNGIRLRGYYHLVKDCTAAANGNHGVVTGEASTLTGNTCYDNGTHGIYAGSGSTIIGNTARSNTWYGIYASSYCLVDQNTAYGNATNIYTETGCVLGANCAP